MAWQVCPIVDPESARLNLFIGSAFGRFTVARKPVRYDKSGLDLRPVAIFDESRRRSARE
jgi:hypothetical protein